MYELADWLATTFLLDVSDWLSLTGLSGWIQSRFWVIPTIQSIHILGIAAVFVSATMINLRILRAPGHDLDLAWTADRFLPWIWWGLPVLLVSGLLLIIGEPHRELLNPTFWMKIILVVAATVATLCLRRSVRRNVALGGGRGPGAALKTAAAALVVLWIAIIVFGRMIAYSPVGA